MRGRRRDRQPGHRLENTIIPALDSGFVVLLDRYTYTAFARDVVRGLNIDWVKHLESDPEGQSWKARIASAASGFSTQADKDGRLGEIVLTTAENKRFDASCTAAVLIRDDGLRDGLMRKIANAASADCASLPWGVFAMHGMRDPQAQAEASALLTQRWKECHEGRE